MTEATTEPVVLTNARARVRDVVTIGVLDPVVRLRIPRSAVVTVEVVPAPAERTVTGVPVSVRGNDRGRTARITPETVAVRVRGAGPTVGQLQPQQVPVYVDVSGRRPGTSYAADSAGSPSGIRSFGATSTGARRPTRAGGPPGRSRRFCDPARPVPPAALAWRPSCLTSTRSSRR